MARRVIPPHRRDPDDSHDSQYYRRGVDDIRNVITSTTEPLGAEPGTLWYNPEGVPDYGVDIGISKDDADELYTSKDEFAAVADVPPRVEAVETAVAGIARVSAYQHGVRANTGTPQNDALHAAFTYAESLGGGAVVELPPGVVTIDGTFSLSGYSSGMVGTTSTTKVGAYGPGNGSILRAVNQTGPVLDFAGFVYPRGQKGRVRFADFAIEGDGTVGAAKKGIYLGHPSGASSVDFQRLTISRTGGVGLHIENWYLSDFQSVTVFNPVDCVAQDTPYVLLEGANGNRFYGLGLRSSNHNDAVPDCPPSGALRNAQGAVYQFHKTVFYGLWFENLHLGTNAAMIVNRANNLTFADTQFFDCYRVSGATGTSYVRFEAPSTQDYGGNQWRGVVPGKGGGGDTDVEVGIIVSQSGNMIDGPKGHGGNNVQLTSGVQWTWALLAGASVAGNNSGFIDGSGNNTNTLIDGPQGNWAIGARSTGNMTMAGGFVRDVYNNMGNVSGSIGLSLNFGHNIFLFTMTGDTTITSISISVSAVGRKMTVMVGQDATGGHTLTWPSNVRFAGGAPPTLSTTPNAVDVFTFVWSSGSVWREVSRSLGT